MPLSSGQLVPMGQAHWGRGIGDQRTVLIKFAFYWIKKRDRKVLVASSCTSVNYLHGAFTDLGVYLKWEQAQIQVSWNLEMWQYLRRGNFKKKYKKKKKKPTYFCNFYKPCDPGRHGWGPAQARGVSSLGEAAPEREQAGEGAAFAKGRLVAWNFDFPPWLGPLQRPSLSGNAAPVLNRSKHSPCGRPGSGLMTEANV